MTTHQQGTQAEMIALLHELAEGWDHLGRQDRATAAVEAANSLNTGASTVRVGASTYSVVTKP